MSRESKKKKIYKPSHEQPGPMWLDYILLPYGAFYEKTLDFFDAEKGDKMRFFNGPEVTIERVEMVLEPPIIDNLCYMRYGISWDKAFDRWLRYAKLEGHGKDILQKDACIIVFYKNEVTE